MGVPKRNSPFWAWKRKLKSKENSAKCPKGRLERQLRHQASAQRQVASYEKKVRRKADL